MLLRRRDVLACALIAAVSQLTGVDAPATTPRRPLRLLLRSSWQTVNIGDIAHTPGVLHLLEKYLPDVEVRLWPSNVDNGVEEMLCKRFPKMHSPIMCIGNGIPAIVCRFKEQTSKGFMWADIGLNEWLFDLDDEAQVARIPATVLALAQDPAAAKIKAAAGRAVVEKRQRETMDMVRLRLGNP